MLLLFSKKMAEVIFFPKGHQNFLFIVYGSIFGLTDKEIEFSIHQEYTKEEDAIECYKIIRALYPENSDMGIQKHTIEQINVP